MIEATETIIQADELEPNIYDVMEELIVIHDQLDVHENHFVSIERTLKEIQSTLAEHGKMLAEHGNILAQHGKILIQLMAGMRVSEHS
jgi:chaperonin cofactor prefoldin